MCATAERAAVLVCGFLLAGCGDSLTVGRDAGGVETGSDAGAPETVNADLVSGCRGPGRYEAGKEGSYQPCCPGLREVFYLAPAYTESTTRICASIPLRVYACVVGRCGDGVCESGEADACGCVADCPSALWGDTPTGEVGEPDPVDGSSDGPRSGAALSLATDVDRTRMAADVLPVVAELVRSMGAELSQFGFTSVADADALQLGRPYGVFTVHKGPWLEFRGYWRVPIVVSGTYRCLVEVEPEGDGYQFFGIGGKDFAPLLAERERGAALSAALDQGRAALLWLTGTYGERYVGYEVFSGIDPVDSEIRAQSLSWYPAAVPGVDGAAPPPELSLAELNAQLPAE
jgi:hypothetical protein